MMDNYAGFEKANVAPVPLDYKQLLLFTTCSEEKDEIGRVSSVTFEREVEYNNVQEADGLYLFQVFLFEASYSFIRAAEPYDTMFKKMAYVFDELMLWADGHGTLTTIHNLPFVQYRWENIREQLMLDFEGEFFEWHVAFMDDMMTDHDKVLRYLSTPSMYGLYFNGCWGSHKKGEGSSCNISYSHELQNITISEKIELEPSKSNRLVQLGVSANEKPDEIYGYKGSYTYLDGILDHANKEISLNPNKTIKYSAQWVGLKSIIP